MSQMSPPVAVTARGITQTGPWGNVYGPLDLTILLGGLTILQAPAGPGRTALQMTLAGRMKPKSGSLTVMGHTGPARIFRASALAAIEDLDSVYASVRVVDLVTEQLRWDAPWYHLIRRADEAVYEQVCRPVFGDRALPPLGEYVENLSELDGILLRVALANTRRPPLLVVGNIDQVTSDQNQRVLVRRLAALGQQQTVITCTVNHVDPALGHRSQVPVHLHTEGGE
ncbi:hypothetical protein [Gordonia caeni]|uniref:ATP-binding cassette domain-containing protein n=1 Tax=Gordonia caeni TaxID=1007097 RepID=A0ABP7NL88_9ACTN